jgi:phage baseplate assembly protein W
VSTLLVPFQFSASGRAASTSDESRIAEQQILDVLVTGGLERVMRPTYGANVARHLFDPMNELNLAETSRAALSLLSRLTTCVVTDVTMTPRENGYASNGTQVAILDVAVRYKLPANPTPFEMRTPLTTYITQETGF